MKLIRPIIVALALALAIPAVACGGTASEEQCNAAADNLVEIMVAEATKGQPDAPEEALQAARDGAEKSRDGFLKACGDAPADAVECLANAEDMGGFTACQQEYAN